MKDTLQVVKNAEKDGHRPIEEYQKDIDTALMRFKSETNIELDSHIFSTLGASGHSLNSKKDRGYTHPYPFLTSFGSYIFGCVAVPADIDDGKPDFTNLYLLATKTHLLVVFHDPHWSYSPFFGGAVLNIINKHKDSELIKVPDVISEILGFAVAATDHALEVLANREEKYRIRIKELGRRNGSDLEREIEKRFPAVEILQIETTSMKNVVRGLSNLLQDVHNGAVLIESDGYSGNFFDDTNKNFLNGLRHQATQLQMFLESLIVEVTSLYQTLNRYQERALTVATHRVTALGALILFPNLIFDYFGQSFEPLPNWIRESGYLFTLGLTSLYWIIQSLWFRRRRYL